jgi:hypothetical protein
MYCLLKSSFVFQISKVLSVYFSSYQGFLKPDLPVEFSVVQVHLRYRYHSLSGLIRPFGFAFATQKMKICYGAMSYTSAITTVNRKKLLHFWSLGCGNPRN